MAWRSAATAERDLDALVALAFAADLQHAYAFDLRDVGDVGAPAGLQIDAGDADQPYASGAARRLHAHGLDELRLQVELGIRDPHGLGGSARDDERVSLAFDALSIELAEIDVEVEPRLVGCDVAAGDRGRDDAGQQVERGVQAHQPVTARPVDLERNRLTGLEHRASGGTDMQHPVRRLPLAGVDDRDCLALWTQELAAVARLATAQGIEHGAVELDAALIDREHPRGRGAQVRVLAEQQLGRHGCDRLRVSLEFTPMPAYAYRIVNVITQARAVLSGNPLCVFERAQTLDAARMQALALQFNLSETTFILPSERASARVRIFTPGFELPFAGHPTLGTAHVCRALGLGGDRITLEMTAGVIPVRAVGDRWTLQCNTPTWREVSEPRLMLAAMLGLEEGDIVERPLWVNAGTEQLIVPLASEAAVRRVG